MPADTTSRWEAGYIKGQLFAVIGEIEQILPTVNSATHEILTRAQGRLIALVRGG